MTSPNDSLHGFFDDATEEEEANLEALLMEHKTVITVIVPRDEPISDCSDLDSSDGLSNEDYTEYQNEETREETIDTAHESVDALDSAMEDMVIIEMEHVNTKSVTILDEDFDNDQSRSDRSSTYSEIRNDDVEWPASPSYTSSRSYSRDGLSEAESNVDNICERTGDVSERISRASESIDQRDIMNNHIIDVPMKNRSQRPVQSSFPYGATERTIQLEKSLSANQNDECLIHPKPKKSFRHQVQKLNTSDATTPITSTEPGQSGSEICRSIGSCENNQKTSLLANYNVSDRTRHVMKPEYEKETSGARGRSRIPVKIDRPTFQPRHRPVLPSVVRVPKCRDSPVNVTAVADVIQQPVVNLHLPRPLQPTDSANGRNPRFQRKLKPDIPHQMQAAACYHDGKMAVSILGDQSILHSRRDPLNVSITFINKRSTTKAAKLPTDEDPVTNKQSTVSSRRNGGTHDASAKRTNRAAEKRQISYCKGRQLPPLKDNGSAQLKSLTTYNGNTAVRQWPCHQAKKKRNKEKHGKKGSKCNSSKERMFSGKTNRFVVEHRALLPPFNTHIDAEASARHLKLFGI